MINIAKNPEDRIEKKGTQKGYAQTGVVVFEKKNKAKKVKVKKDLLRRKLCFSRREKEVKKSCAQTGIVLFQTPLSSLAASGSAAASNCVSRG